MIGLTHAIGGATSIMSMNYFFPGHFKLNIWIIILSFYVSQLPDIDMKKSSISRNPFIIPFRIILSPLIDGHRAKQTHSLYGTLMFSIIILPLVGIFGFSGWFLLTIAYFSHIFLDYFNPTGVKLFYFPILNNNPRDWSLYNTPFLLSLEIPFFFKTLFYIIFKYILRFKKVSKPERKKIKFDGVGVLTGQGVEKIITYLLWIGFILGIFINLSTLKEMFINDSLILSSFPIISILLILTILLKEGKEIKSVFKYINLFLFLSIIILLISKYTEILQGDLIKQLKDINIYTSILFIFIFSLTPLLIRLIFLTIKNIMLFPKMLLPSKESTSYFNSAINYPILTHMLILGLLISSMFQINIYDNSIKNLYSSYTTQNQDELIPNLINNIKNQYINSYKILKEEVNENYNKS